VEEQLTSALIEEATKKSSLIWLSIGGRRPRAVWHIWLDGAIYLVSGGAEQPARGLDQAAADSAPVTVTVRSKDKGGRLVTFEARPSRVEPGTEEWDAAVAELHAKRLNAPDGEQQPARWARESSVTRLVPAGSVTERPGDMPAGSHAAPPPPSRATTLGKLPFVLGRRRRGPRR
jgi:hypothetical protein